MALLFMDGFDHYTALTQKGWVLGGWGGGISGGRNGNGGYTGVSWIGGSDGSVQRNFASKDEIVFGIALNFSDLNTIPYLQLREGGTVHLQINRNSTSGVLEFYRGPGSALLGTSSFVSLANTWFYLEVRIKIHDTAGTLKARVNGLTQVDVTSQDTRNGATGVVDTLLIGANRVNSGFTFQWAFDDVYICDVLGSANNDMLGDCKVETLFPNANGNSSVLLGSDADSTNNYLLVDETPPNDDTDYVESSTVGDKDTYAYTNLVTSAGSVYGVQCLPYAKKNDSGPVRSIASVARLSSTEVDSANKTLTTAYLYLPDIRETKPGGGSWTIADVNNAEFGVKVTA